MNKIINLVHGRTYILYIDTCGNTIPVDANISIEPVALTKLLYPEDAIFIYSKIQLQLGSLDQGTITNHLSVLPKSYENIFVEICPENTYLGFNEAGIYELIEVNILGCDSITTIDLTVLGEMDPTCFVSSLYEVSNYKITAFANPISNMITVPGVENSSIRYSIIYSIKEKLFRKTLTIPILI